MEIKQISVQDLDFVVPLFDAYRVFYKQSSNLESARNFLYHRLNNKESYIFLALIDGNPAGFTQLFTTFSSVSLQPFFILNDLYVTPEYRKRGVGEAHLNQAKSLCISLHYKGVALETATDNPAQQLYERLHWEKDEAFFHYFWKNTNAG